MDQPVSDAAVNVMWTKLVCVAILPLVAMSQDIPDGVKYDLTDLIYPRVAHLARVQEVVKLELIPSETSQEVKLVSGNAMLRQQARDNLPKWHTNERVTVNYTFGLTDPDIVRVRVPRGDAFDRLWLRMFHLATYTEVSRCQQTSSSLLSKVAEPRAVQRSLLTIEIETTAPTSCLILESSHASLQRARGVR